jgi:hypothetical protein
VIANFVDRSWQLVGDQEREQYLTRLATGLARSEWALIGYALMSSHIHLLMVASDAPLSAWAKPVHVGMAQWLNRRCDRLGPVFAGRPYCEIVSPRAVPIVLAYLHNNPVRAHVVAHAAQSTWTSHRAYLGIETPAPGLDVPYGLTLAGFGNDAASRNAFSEWVDACASAKPQGVTPHTQVSTLRSALRQRLGSSLELGTATRELKGATFPLLASASRSLQPRIELDTHDVIQAVFVVTGVDLRTPLVGRPRSVSHARRTALKVWSLTGRHRSLMVRAIGMSPNGASQLISTTSTDDPALARAVAKVLELLVPSSQVQVWAKPNAESEN